MELKTLWPFLGFKMIIIGDVHGCYETLMALIEKLPKNRKIVFCGDLIDRGEHSRKVVDFVKNGGYDCVQGNHEWMAYDDHASFKLNGGKNTDREYFDNPELWEEHKAWFKTLPCFIKYEDAETLFNRKLVVSHTTLAVNWEKLHYLAPSQLVWDREMVPDDIPGWFNIYGHTPVSNPQIDHYFANIDTGAVFGRKLTAIAWPELEIIQQDCIDRPFEY